VLSLSHTSAVHRPSLPRPSLLPLSVRYMAASLKPVFVTRYCHRTILIGTTALPGPHTRLC
jgi:hypothetical protein